MDKEKMTITKEDVGTLDVTPVDFKLKRAGNFNNPINGNALIGCPGCRGMWGAAKWGRIVKEDKMTCPGCGKTFEKGSEFKVSYLDREYETKAPNTSAPPSTKNVVGAKATIKAKDKLIRKGDT
jgi:hypothetical protein